MDSKIKICSYNCQSFNVNAVIVQHLMTVSDIIFLQKTLIDDNNAHVFNNFDVNFMSFYVPASRNQNISTGRSSGGLAMFVLKWWIFLWKSHGMHIRFIKQLNYSWLAGEKNILCYNALWARIIKNNKALKKKTHFFMLSNFILDFLQKKKTI